MKTNIPGCNLCNIILIQNELKYDKTKDFVQNGHHLVPHTTRIDVRMNCTSFESFFLEYCSVSIQVSVLNLMAWMVLETCRAHFECIPTARSRKQTGLDFVEATRLIQLDQSIDWSSNYPVLGKQLSQNEERLRLVERSSSCNNAA